MNPKAFEIAFLKARSAAKKGNLSEAGEILDMLLRLAPGNARVIKAMNDLRSNASVDRVTPAIVPLAVAPTKTKRLPLSPEDLQRVIKLCSTNLVEGVAFGEALLAKYPDSVVLMGILGPAYASLGRHGLAQRSLRNALLLAPDTPELHSALGDSLRGEGRNLEAIDSFQRAVALKPTYAKAHLNLGYALKALRRFSEAADCITKSIELQPGSALAHYTLGDALESMGRPDRALECYEQAVRLDPAQNAARAAAHHMRMRMCNWQAISEFAEIAPSLGIGEGVPVAPFGLMAMEDEPAHHRARAELFVRVDFPKVKRHVFSTPRSRTNRLRIGYFSSDLHDGHPMLSLISGVFREHDATRFEIICFSNSEGPDGPLRRAMVGRVDHLLDIQSMPDNDVLSLAHSLDLHIAVDLNGLTAGNRSKLFAHGLAPVQMNYLGYPGTIGGAFMDYIVVDPVVVPSAERGNYSESLLVMPHSYMPTDNQRVVPSPLHPRSYYGLPDDGFVFCCFNNSFKITPREFDIWMRLLRSVPGSVVWLLSGGPWVSENLGREAAARGVDPSRLVISQRVERGEHLARHAHADLFLDTFCYNAHTTACEALWTGLPLVTMQGRSFAARVASSLVGAIGLPELVTHTPQDYEALAHRLATDHLHLEDIRTRLKAQLPDARLFDTLSYTRALESGYDAAYERFIQGKAPADIHLS